MKYSKDYTLKGSGFPVVMLHSSMSNKEQWHKLSSLLTENFQVLAIDLIGYGESEYPEDPDSFSLKDETRRVQSIISQAINEQPFHLIGHSYGGATALRLTYEAELIIKSLSIFEPVAFHLLVKGDPALLQVTDIVQNIDNQLQQGDLPAATKLFVDFWSGDGTFDDISEEKQVFLERYIRKVALDFQALINEPLTLQDYQTITLPVCMITSPHSPLPTRQIVDNLRMTLPNMELHHTAGGHMAPIGNAREVNPIFEAFLRSF